MLVSGNARVGCRILGPQVDHSQLRVGALGGSEDLEFGRRNEPLVVSQPLEAKPVQVSRANCTKDGCICSLGMIQTINKVDDFGRFADCYID